MHNTQLPPQKALVGMPPHLDQVGTLDLVRLLQRFDRAFPSAFGPRRRQLDCHMTAIETELLRRAGLALNGQEH